jgi:CheY-like chemotaxis protein
MNISNSLVGYSNRVIDAAESSGYPVSSSSKQEGSLLMTARGGIWILLVDGEATVQHLRALMLRMKGYHVDIASNLDEAYAKLDERTYKLVIVDVGHYADKGIEFCEELKNKNPHQKVLIHAEDRVFPLKNDCPDDVIPKQEGPVTFVNAVERCLGAV